MNPAHIIQGAYVLLACFVCWLAIVVILSYRRERRRREEMRKVARRLEEFCPPMYAPRDERGSR